MRYLSIFLCVKYLCRRKIVLLSVAAVALSSALLIVVASLFSGFIGAFEDGIKEHSGDVVMVASRGFKISRFDEFIDKLEQNPAVESATAVLSSHGGLLFLGPTNVRAVQIMGIEMPKRSEVLPFKNSLVRQRTSDDAPSFNYEGSDGSCGFAGIGVLTTPDEVTDEFDMAVVDEFIGKNVRLTTGSSDGSKTELLKFKISDVVHSGFYAADKDFIYLPIELVSEKFYPGQGNIADLIQIRIDPSKDTETAVAIINGLWQDFAVNELGLSSYQIYQVDVKTSLEKYAELIGEYRKQMGMLMLIFGVVSGGVVLLISCIFYAIVMTKRKDIAVV
ncbi:MAG: ABC transporter permease, partial [Anaerohalosphaera sp.]|nr:ABC transporter permease [Anaerohalosphaera sp.]